MGDEVIFLNLIYSFNIQYTNFAFSENLIQYSTKHTIKKGEKSNKVSMLIFMAFRILWQYGLKARLVKYGKFVC